MERSIELAQLQKLMQVRIKKWHTLYLTQLEIWREAKRKAEESREEVAKLDHDLQRVIEYLERADVVSDPTKLQLVVSRRRWTIYDKEKAQYYLDMAEDELSEASDELERRKKIWLKGVARENMLDEQRIDAQIEERKLQELREDVAFDDAYVRSALTPNSAPEGTS